MTGWVPGDGSSWRYERSRHRWAGTIPGDPEITLERSVAGFRYAYPQAPHWDGWTARTLALYGPPRWIRWLEFEPHWWTR